MQIERWLKLLQAMSLVSWLGFILPVSIAVDPTCNHFQNATLGQTYYVYSPNYPQKYNAGVWCKWFAQGMAGTKIILTCENIDLPASDNCSMDRLSISLTGDITLRDAHNYCGKGTVSLVSKSNKMTVELFTRLWSSRGKFLCTLTSVQVEVPEPTTKPPPTSCDCGWKQEKRIVGGQETGINEFPSMAGLVDLPRKDLFCGATIISAYYVLTAAHCLRNRNVSEIGVLVGEHDISIGTDTPAAAIYRSGKFIEHPEYDLATQHNDIALVKTTQPIKFSAKVGPVCLPFKYSSQSFSKEIVTALGWGTTEFTGPKSDVLQKVNLKVVDNSFCQNDLPGDKIVKTQLCTFAPAKDTCQSDSGGPLLWDRNSNKRLQLVGIVSFGKGCATDTPGVSTRVTSYLTWIVSSTSDAEYCIK